MTTPAGAVVYEFGSFRLDAADGVLTRGAAPVAIAPKVIATLLALVEHAGRVVSKEQLMARVWPDTFVDESNLAQNIFRLRKILGGESDQTFIQTVPRRGYRFIHPVRVVMTKTAAPAAVQRRAIPLRVLFAALASVAVLFTAARCAVTRDAGDRPAA